MSTRYVWNKCETTVKEVVKEHQNVYRSYYGQNEPSGPEAFYGYACKGYRIHGWQYELDTDAGIESIYYRYNENYGPSEIPTLSYKYMQPKFGTFPADYVGLPNGIILEAEQVSYNTVWHAGISTDTGGKPGYNKSLSLANKDTLDEVNFIMTIRQLQYAPGEVVEKVSSENSNAYPKDKRDDQTRFYWDYLGSDTIDPLSVTYSTREPRGGDPIDINVNPRSPTYGGTVYYQYQVSTDGGKSWSDLGGKTTSTSNQYTLPKGTEQFRARVLASDDMGFTSTTFVTGANIGVMNIRAYIGVNGKARKVTKAYIGVNGKAREVTAGYVGIGGKARDWF